MWLENNNLCYSNKQNVSVCVCLSSRLVGILLAMSLDDHHPNTTNKCAYIDNETIDEDALQVEHTTWAHPHRAHSWGKLRNARNALMKCIDHVHLCCSTMAR